MLAGYLSMRRGGNVEFLKPTVLVECAPPSQYCRSPTAWREGCFILFLFFSRYATFTSKKSCPVFDNDRNASFLQNFYAHP